VLVPLIISVCAGVAFLLAERQAASPLISLPLLRRHPNYLGSTVSQFIAGMAEMGLALLFPLLLILNLGMSPALAGLALIPTTLPMVFVAPLAGRWYDGAGGRPPLVTGFAVLLVSTLLPGLLLYGIGLALILTVNDPVSLDTVPSGDHGQASGVSATAEQFGGAVGIAGLYLIFHATYVSELHSKIARSPLPNLTPHQNQQLKHAIIAAESTGLRPGSFNRVLAPYLFPARSASNYGFSVAFIAVSVLSLLALILMIRLIRKPPRQPRHDDAGLAESRPGPAPPPH
jgi:MFS family permease